MLLPLLVSLLRQCCFSVGSVVGFDVVGHFWFDRWCRCYFVLVSLVGGFDAYLVTSGFAVGVDALSVSLLVQLLFQGWFDCRIRCCWSVFVSLFVSVCLTVGFRGFTDCATNKTQVSQTKRPVLITLQKRGSYSQQFAVAGSTRQHQVQQNTPHDCAEKRHQHTKRPAATHVGLQSQGRAVG
jgi:hypothetical protein